MRQRQVGAVATVFRVEGTDKVRTGDRVLLFPHGKIVSQITDSQLEDIITQNLQSVLR